MEVPSSGSFDTGTLTLEAWVRLTSDVGPGQVRIITRQQQGQVFPAWGLEIFGAGYIGSTGNELAFHARHSTSSDVYRSGYNLVKGRWYHVAATDDGTTASMYVDGTLVYQHAADGAVVSPTGVAVEIGAALNGTDYFVPGDLDEVRFWNVARTAQQISDSRSDTLPTGATGLVGYWRFDEGSGTTAYDYSGNGHAGTLMHGATRIAEGWRAPAPIGSVVVSPAGAIIAGAGNTATLTATVRDTFNVAVTGQTVVWSSLNPNVATVNPSTGVVTAVGAGQMTVKATSGSATGYALVTVVTPALAATPVNLWAPMVSGLSTFSSGVWGTSATDVWATDGPNVLRWNGTQWNSQTVGYASGIWGSSTSDVFIVGEGGAVWHFNGATWSPMDRATTSRLWAVWGSSPTDVFAVGYNGTIVHYDGSAWSTMSTGTTAQLMEIWGSSRSDVFAAGMSGTLLHYDGTGWAPTNPGTDQWIQGVWGTTSTDVFATVITNQLLHWNGSAWAEVANGQSVGRMWGTSNQDVYLLGDDIKRYDGSTLREVPGTALPGNPGNLLAIWGSPNGAVFVFGGVEGLVRRGYRGATVAVTPAAPTLTAVGATQQLAATARDASHNLVAGVSGWTWSSATPSVATVASTGKF